MDYSFSEEIFVRVIWNECRGLTSLGCCRVVLRLNLGYFRNKLASQQNVTQTTRCRCPWLESPFFCLAIVFGLLMKILCGCVAAAVQFGQIKHDQIERENCFRWLVVECGLWGLRMDSLAWIQTAAAVYGGSIPSTTGIKARWPSHGDRKKRRLTYVRRRCKSDDGYVDYCW